MEQFPPDHPLLQDKGAYGEHLRVMRDVAFCNSERYTAQQGRANRVGAHSDILQFERKLIKRARKLGVPLFAHCVVRSAKEQDQLFVMGHSKAKAGQSPHNYGMAVDIVHGTHAWGLLRRQWDIIGLLGKEIAVQAGLKVVWGGDWQFYDPAHWELRDWRTLRDKLEVPPQ